VGDGHNVRVGEDLWVGCCEGFRLPENVLLTLGGRGIFYLYQVADPILTTIWSQEWRTAEQLGLFGDEAVIWGVFIRSLTGSHVRLKEAADELLWSNNPGQGQYTPKLGYIHLFYCS
jgi:hypothetical protein